MGLYVLVNQRVSLAPLQKLFLFDLLLHLTMQISLDEFVWRFREEVEVNGISLVLLKALKMHIIQQSFSRNGVLVTLENPQITLSRIYWNSQSNNVPIEFICIYREPLCNAI